MPALSYSASSEPLRAPHEQAHGHSNRIFQISAVSLKLYVEDKDTGAEDGAFWAQSSKYLSKRPTHPLRGRGRAEELSIYSFMDSFNKFFLSLLYARIGLSAGETM